MDGVVLSATAAHRGPARTYRILEPDLDRWQLRAELELPRINRRRAAGAQKNALRV